MPPRTAGPGVRETDQAVYGPRLAGGIRLRQAAIAGGPVAVTQRM